MTEKKKALQWCWWWDPREWLWGFKRTDPESSWSYIYDWFLFLGPLEVRKWAMKRAPRPGETNPSKLA